VLLLAVLLCCTEYDHRHYLLHKGLLYSYAADHTLVLLVVCAVTATSTNSALLVVIASL
jgi:hypothetical protein